jgi:hypothetical protein
MKAVMEVAETDASGDVAGWKHEGPSEMEFSVHPAEVKVVCASSTGPLSLYFLKDKVPYNLIPVQHSLY